jgi:prenyltransferase beta subunit
MTTPRTSILTLAAALFFFPAGSLAAEPDVLATLREFARRTALPDGSFRPGVDPAYAGISDSAYSDLAPVVYAVVIHKTFGWPLPDEAKTRAWLLARQRDDGAFVNVKGTVDPKSAPGRVYNTTMALMALHALGPVFDQVLVKDYKELPAYSSSFFPLAYTLAGRPLSEEQNRRLRATMVQAEDGYLNDHVAATFHAAHYDRLLGAATPKADRIVARALREQKADGSWMLNPPARDRHATFDAVFTLKHLGGDSPECRMAIGKAADWALSCRNADGGFGHFPGSTSDWDAVFFHAGTLVMAGRLKPADPLPRDAHLLGWGHLMFEKRGNHE